MLKAYEGMVLRENLPTAEEYDYNSWCSLQALTPWRTLMNFVMAMDE